MCKCGCNTCETKIRGPLLTESKVKSLLSENLQYHIDKQIPLFESDFRIGSNAHLRLIKEARKMYSRNIIDLCEEDEHLIKTHLGEFALYEGESVPLDLPMLEEGQDAVCATCGEHGYDEDLDRPCTNCGDYNWSTDYEGLGDKFGEVYEAEDKKKTPPIGKPKRGGSKAYYVYVRDPKTKKVKKVSFGSGGLRAKIKNKEARNAFAARHNCKDKKDRTKAGYWSCNLPRYAQVLGLGANMNTFW